jgi:hypothetical protein
MLLRIAQSLDLRWPGTISDCILALACILARIGLLLSAQVASQSFNFDVADPSKYLFFYSYEIFCSASPRHNAGYYASGPEL